VREGVVERASIVDHNLCFPSSPFFVFFLFSFLRFLPYYLSNVLTWCVLFISGPFLRTSYGLLYSQLSAAFSACTIYPIVGYEFPFPRFAHDPGFNIVVKMKSSVMC